MERPDFNSIFLFPIKLRYKAIQYILFTCICNKNLYYIKNIRVPWDYIILKILTLKEKLDFRRGYTYRTK